MREEIKGDEVSLVESIATRDRKLRASFSRDEPPKPDPAPIETPEAISVPVKEEVGQIKDAPREDAKRRRSKAMAEPQDYMALFLHEAAITARSGKTVYICQEHHERISKILHVIGKNEVSLFSYIHNVLEHHFSTYQEDMNDLYDTKLSRKVF